MYEKFLVIDCQTSGMHPNNSFIVQLGWSFIDNSNTTRPTIEKRNLQLPGDVTLSTKIKKMLDIKDTDYLQAQCPEQVLLEFKGLIEQFKSSLGVIIHYAPFELRFLQHYFNHYLVDSFPALSTICTQKLTKLLLPNLPSYRLKALAGYFDFEAKPSNEVTSHIQATIDLWQRLKPLLKAKNIISFEEIISWMASQTSIKPAFYRYHIDNAMRLSLEAKPGIYKMIAKNNEILYIGKATSLKNRVNSYFRGCKNRDKRILEMLAQVHRIETQTCNSPIEAELLESDLIKQHWPVYNIALKNTTELMFYSRDFNEVILASKQTCYQGPYKLNNRLTLLFDFYEHLYLEQAFPFISDCLEETNQAVELFHQRNFLSLDWQVKLSRRQLLAIGHHLLRRFEKNIGKHQFERWWQSQKKSNVLLKEDPISHLADRIWRLFIRAAIAHQKSKSLVRLRQSRVKIHATNRYWMRAPDQRLNSNLKSFPSDWDIKAYDTFSILLAAKRKKLITTWLLI